MEPAAGEKTLDIISTIPVVCKGPGQCGVDLHIHTDNGIFIVSYLCKNKKGTQNA